MEFEAISVCNDYLVLITNGELPTNSVHETDQVIIDGTIGVMYDGEDIDFTYTPYQC